MYSVARITAVALLSAATLALLPVAAHAANSIPRQHDGKPDLSGIWQTTSFADYDLEPESGRDDAPPTAGVIEGGTIPYLPRALEQRQKNFDARLTADPRLKCFTLGTPRGIYYPEPFQILQRAQDVTVFFEFGHSVRTIHTDGTLHPVDTDNEFWLGDSRGHWEGDTLVVDVTDFSDETWLDRSGDFHSHDLHVVERWHLLDANTLDYHATLEDPAVYSRPWTIDVILYRHREKDFQLIENYCYTHPYDQYYPYPKRYAPTSGSAPSAATTSTSNQETAP
jgi:hypothetical protein